MKCFIIFFLLISSFYSSNGQTISVLDSIQQTPVIGATVAIFNQKTGEIKIQGLTDENGHFVIGKVGAATFYISIVAVGYKKIVKNLETLSFF